MRNAVFILLSLSFASSAGEYTQAELDAWKAKVRAMEPIMRQGDTTTSKWIAPANPVPPPPLPDLKAAEESAKSGKRGTWIPPRKDLPPPPPMPPALAMRKAAASSKNTKSQWIPPRKDLPPPPPWPPRARSDGP